VQKPDSFREGRIAPGRYSEQPPIGIGERTPDCLAAFPDDLSPPDRSAAPFRPFGSILSTIRWYYRPAGGTTYRR